MSLDLQPLRAEDEPFLFELYASTRGDEMALVGWDKPQQEAFLRMQFKAQRSSYASLKQRTYPFEHPVLGKFRLFVVPSDPGVTPRYYTAIINHSTS